MFVLLDTNFLFLPHQHKIDVFSELGGVVQEAHELVTLSAVVRELEMLASSRSDDGVAARVGLELLRRNNVRVVPAEGPADESITAFAAENRGMVIVCTNDAGLKRRLEKMGVPMVVMRSKKHLMRV